MPAERRRSDRRRGAAGDAAANDRQPRGCAPRIRWSSPSARSTRARRSTLFPIAPNCREACAHSTMTCARRCRSASSVMLRGLCEAMRLHYRFDYRWVYPPTVNDRAANDVVREVARRIVGAENVVDPHEIVMWSEDMAFMQQERPGRVLLRRRARPDDRHRAAAQCALRYRRARAGGGLRDDGRHRAHG